MGIQDILGAAASNIASAQVAAAQLEADNNRLIVDLSATEAVLAEQEQRIMTLTARNAELEALLAGGGGEEPPPAPRMLIGASVQRRGTETWGSSLSRFEASVSTSAGRPFKCDVVRRFSGVGVIPTMNMEVFRGLEGYHRIFSFKGNPTKEQLVDWMLDFPDDGCENYVASWHEPEKDLTREQFLVRQATLEAAIDEVRRISGRTDVHKTIIVMSWWERDAPSAGTSSATYWPDDLTGWVLGIDPYDRHQDKELWQLATPTLDLWRERGGTRWLLAECATKRKGADAVGWIERAGEWAKSEGAEAFCWFDSKQGDDQGVPLGEGFFLDLRGPTSEAAFAALID